MLIANTEGLQSLKILFFVFFLIFLFHVLMTFERDGRVCGGHMSTPKKAEVQQKNHRRMDHTEQKGSQKGRMWDVTVLKGALKMLKLHSGSTLH